MAIIIYEIHGTHVEVLHVAKVHPTPVQASKLIKRFSNRDLHEISRMSRSVTDHDKEYLFSAERVEGEVHRQARKHKRRWQRWLERKGPDLVIIFEDDG